MSEVVTIGETMVLFTTSGPQRKIKSSTTLNKQVGGAESNVAIALSRMGHDVKWVSRLGNDPFGEEILYRLRGEGVSTNDVIIDLEHSTGLMFKEKPVSGDPSVYYYRGNSAASFLDKSDLKKETIGSAKILHITGITPALSESCRETIFEAVKIAKENSVKVSLDPNIRLKLWTIDQARSTIMDLAKQADYFFPGIDEARMLINNLELTDKEVVEYFLDLGIETVAVKLGPDGCMVGSENEIAQVEGFQVEEVDSVGAGDGFCAGFLSGILNGLSLKECARRANIVGALAVTSPTDYDGYPTAKELEDILNQTSTVTR